jgi:predicted permease
VPLERWLFTITHRFRSLFRGGRLDRELEEEIQDHIDRKTEDFAAQGMAAQDARRAALIELGGVEKIREECRDVRRVNWIQDLIQDLRYGLRMLARSPGFSAVAIATLAIGIGANTAIFSVVYAVLLRPLPFPHPGELVFLSESKPQEGIKGAGASYDDYTEIRAQNHVFSELGTLTTHELTVTGRGEPAVADIAGIGPELLRLLEITPVAGRALAPDDGKPGAEAVVVVSETAWRSRFAADPNLVGSTISLDHRPFTLVGVIPDDPGILLAPRQVQFWIPLRQDPLFGPWIPRHGLRFLGVVARMKPDVAIPQAQAEMDTIATRLAAEFPGEDSGWTIRLAPLDRAIIGDMRAPLLLLLGAVAIVLLIACANISSLLLARATARGREIALRISLGAGRARIVRQLLTESAMLGLLGGAAGVMLAYWGVRGLVPLLPAGIPQVHAIRVDAPVLLFALAISILASLIFGLAPALFAVGSGMQATLKESASHASEPRARRFARGFLAAAEVALAMVLLVASGLLLRSFASLTAVNPGFTAARVVKADIQLPQFQYSKPEQWTAFAGDLLDRLRSQPGMRDCAIAAPLPLNKQGAASLPFEIVGRAPVAKGTPQSADFSSISGDYFRVMEIPLVRGRAFNEHDVSFTPRVTVISETFARRFFPNQDPIGQQLMFNFPPRPPVSREIVGVVGDVRDVSIGQDPGPMMYVPFDQMPLWGGQVVVRSDLGVGSVAAAIRRQVHEVDKDLPVTEVVSMSDLIDFSVAQPRFRTWLLGSFGLMALVLATAGIFGVISYSVSRRTQEIGIRISLGASPVDVLAMVLGESLRLVTAGLAVGILAALGLGRFLSKLLFGVHASDPVTFFGVAILLFTVATIAAYIPARRATRVDPVTALRCE